VIGALKHREAETHPALAHMQYRMGLVMGVFRMHMEGFKADLAARTAERRKARKDKCKRLR